MDYQIEELDHTDFDAVWNLYQYMLGVTPHGFLALRDENEFRRLVGDPEYGVAVGAKLDGKLVGYSLGSRTDVIPYVSTPLTRRIMPATQGTFLAKGTVVDPAHAGQRLMPKLISMRMQTANRRGGTHLLGLASIENIASLNVFLKQGAALCGFCADETAMNYIIYCGGLVPSDDTIPTTVAVEFADRDRQAVLFDQGQIATKLFLSEKKSNWFEFKSLGNDS